MNRSQKKGTYSELWQRQNHLPNDSPFSSVAQSCPTFCNPMDCSTPGFPVHHQLLELAQTHVHRVSDAIQPSHPLSSPSPPNNFLRKKTEQGSEIDCGGEEGQIRLSIQEGLYDTWLDDKKLFAKWRFRGRGNNYLKDPKAEKKSVWLKFTERVKE